MKEFPLTLIRIICFIGIIGMLLWAIASLLSIVAFAETQYPTYSNYVNDYAQVLPDDKEKELNKKIKEYDAKTSNQIAVLTVKTTGEETIEEYAIHVADRWKPGQEKKENGLLFVYAMEDRKMRLEVGRGLEDDVTDIEAKHVLDDDVKPFFKDENYYEGINAGIDGAIAAIAQNEEASAGFSEEASEVPAWLIILIFLLVLVILGVIITGIAYSPYTPLGGSGSTGFGPVWGDSSSSSDNDGFGGFGGGGFSGGGSSSSW